MRFFAWGSNFSGQLCTGYRSNQIVTTPIEVKLFSNEFLEQNKLKSIVGGREQTYFLFDNGEVYGCGANNIGQLGDLELFVPVPTLLTSLSGYRIKKLSARNETVFAITENSHCIGWGSNLSGQLGVPPFEMINTKKPVLICKNAIDVSAGNGHVAVLKKQRKLVTCGSYKFGEIGRPFNRRFKPEFVVTPEIQSFACGGNHTVAVTLQGHVYGWGCNSYGETGVRPRFTEYVIHPQKIDIDFHLNVDDIHVKCGNNHSVLYAENGQILTWGRNQFGQISGKPHIPEYDWKPALLYDFCHIDSLEVGGNHNLVIHHNKEVHFWGWTQGDCSSKLIHAHSSPYIVKTDLNNDEPLEGLLVGAGEKHSIIAVK